MNPRILTLTAAAPAPVGCDVLNLDAQPLTAADFDLRDNDSHALVIPCAVIGCAKLSLAAQVTPAFDAPVTLALEAGYGGGLNIPLARVTVPADMAGCFDFAPGAASIPP